MDQSAAVVTAANSMRTQGKLELFQTVRVLELGLGPRLGLG